MQASAALQPNGSGQPFVDAASPKALHRKCSWRAFWADDCGQGLVEYIIIIGMIAAGLTFIVLTLRNSVGLFAEATAGALEEHMPNGCKNPTPLAKNPNCS